MPEPGAHSPLPFTSDDVRAALDELEQLGPDSDESVDVDDVEGPSASAPSNGRNPQVAGSQPAASSASALPSHILGNLPRIDGDANERAERENIQSATRVEVVRPSAANPQPRSYQGDLVEGDADPGEADAASRLDAPDGAQEYDAGSDGNDAEDGGDWDDEPYDQRAADASVEKRRRKPHAGKVIVGIVVLLVIVAVGVAGYFAWDRWGRYDDRADVQGDWYVEGTAAPVSIDAGAIHLAQNVAYKYELDDREKTLTYTFGNWEGAGRYRFSADRKHLMLVDGEFDGKDTTVDDILHSFQDVASRVTGSGVEFPEGEGIIVLNRNPNPVALVARQMSEQIAAKKAPQEDSQEDEEYDEYEEYE